MFSVSKLFFVFLFAYRYMVFSTKEMQVNGIALSDVKCAGNQNK